MSYFPILFSLNDKKILLIGAGDIATRKLEKLLDFTTNITILSPIINEKIKELAKKHNLEIKSTKYKTGDIKAYDIVIVAIDDIKLQEEIYNECKKEKVLCNCVDLLKCCDFIFPSYIQEGDLTVSISTNGSSPAFTKEFKNYLKSKIPKDIDVFLKQMKNLRVSMPKGKERMEYLEKKVKEYFSSWN